MKLFRQETPNSVGGQKGDETSGCDDDDDDDDAQMKAQRGRHMRAHESRHIRVHIWKRTDESTHMKAHAERT